MDALRRPWTNLQTHFSSEGFRKLLGVHILSGMGIVINWGSISGIQSPQAILIFRPKSFGTPTSQRRQKPDSSGSLNKARFENPRTKWIQGETLNPKPQNSQVDIPRNPSSGSRSPKPSFLGLSCKEDDMQLFKLQHLMPTPRALNPKPEAFEP